MADPHAPYTVSFVVVEGRFGGYAIGMQMTDSNSLPAPLGRMQDARTMLLSRRIHATPQQAAHAIGEAMTQMLEPKA